MESIVQIYSIAFAKWISKNNYKLVDIYENQLDQTGYKYQRWAESYLKPHCIFEGENTLTDDQLYEKFKA